MPIAKTSLNMGASAALAGTACLGLERIVHFLYGKSQSLLPASEGREKAFVTSLGRDKVQLGVSHVMGGLGGGVISGGLFNGKPIAGAFYFVPLMCGVAVLEVKWDEYRMEHLRRMLVAQEEGKDHQTA